MKQVITLMLISGILYVSAGCSSCKSAYELVAKSDEFEVYLSNTDQGSKRLEIKNISQSEIAVFNSLYDMTYSSKSYSVDANGTWSGTKEKVTDWTSIVVLQPEHAFSYPLDLEFKSKFTLSTKQNRLGEEGLILLKKSKVKLMRNDISLNLERYK